MKTKIFSIRDTKISVYNTPFVAIDVISATRMLHVAVRDSSTNINQFPADFDLYQMAEFDTVTGQIEPLPVPKFIINAKILRHLDEQEQQATAKQSSEIQSNSQQSEVNKS